MPSTRGTDVVVRSSVACTATAFTFDVLAWTVTACLGLITGDWTVPAVAAVAGIGLFVLGLIGDLALDAHRRGRAGDR